MYDKLKSIAWRWQSMGGAMTNAPLGGDKPGPNSTDRDKLSVKRSVLTDVCGVPLSVAGANVHDQKLEGRIAERHSRASPSSARASEVAYLFGSRLRRSGRRAVSSPPPLRSSHPSTPRRSCALPTRQGPPLGRRTHPFVDQSLSATGRPLGKQSRELSPVSSFLYRSRRN